MATSWLKKTSALLALAVMLGSFSGCSGDTESDGGTAETGEAVTSEVEEPAIKVGYIFKGEVDLGGYSSDANDFRLGASKHSDVESYYIDNVNITDFPKAVEMLSDIGCTYIVSGNWQYHNMLTEVAGKNMNLNFVSHGARIRNVNVSAYTDQMYEGAYVAGMAAAYNSENEKVGIVVDPSMIYSRAVINAAQLGAQLVYKDAETVAAFAAENGEIHSAVDALVNMGCDVIISYTESPETASYCNSKGIKFVGNLNYGDKAADYENMIMYFYADHGSYYLAQTKMIQLENWEPEEYVGTLSNGVVNVSTALTAAKAGTQDIISALVPKISGGQANIFAGEIKDINGNVVILQNKAMQPSEVYAMDWYVKGVNVDLDTFVVPRTDIETSDLDIER